AFRAKAGRPSYLPIAFRKSRPLRAGSRGLGLGVWATGKPLGLPHPPRWLRRVAPVCLGLRILRLEARVELRVKEEVPPSVAQARTRVDDSGRQRTHVVVGDTAGEEAVVAGDIVVARVRAGEDVAIDQVVRRSVAQLDV